MKKYNTIIGNVKPRLRSALLKIPYIIPLKNVLFGNSNSIIYEEQVCKTIRKVVKPGWICADVGANIGLIAVEMAHATGRSGKVVAFEPLDENIQVLTERIKYLSLAKVVVAENLAISDGGSRRIWLHSGRGNSPAEWNIVGHDVNGVPTPAVKEVDAVSLDQYFEPGERLDFVKIDIEGAAGYALKGMHRLIREQKPAFLIEFHDEEEWASRVLLINEGYELFELDGTPIGSGLDVQRRYHCLALYNSTALA